MLHFVQRNNVLFESYLGNVGSRFLYIAVFLVYNFQLILQMIARADVNVLRSVFAHTLILKKEAQQWLNMSVAS